MICRFAHIENGVVTNVSLWDGETEWNPNCEVVKLEDVSPVSIGWSYIESQFVAPPMVEHIFEFASPEQENN